MAASVLAAGVAGQPELARQRHRTLAERGIGRRPRSWLAVADIWVGADDHTTSTVWLDDGARVRERWNDRFPRAGYRSLALTPPPPF